MYNISEQKQEARTFPGAHLGQPVQNPNGACLHRQKLDICPQSGKSPGRILPPVRDELPPGEAVVVGGPVVQMACSCPNGGMRWLHFKTIMAACSVFRLSNKSCRLFPRHTSFPVSLKSSSRKPSVFFSIPITAQSIVKSSTNSLLGSVVLLPPVPVSNRRTNCFHLLKSSQVASK